MEIAYVSQEGSGNGGNLIPAIFDEFDPHLADDFVKQYLARYACNSPAPKWVWYGAGAYQRHVKSISITIYELAPTIPLYTIYISFKTQEEFKEAIKILTELWLENNQTQVHNSVKPS